MTHRSPSSVATRETMEVLSPSEASGRGGRRSSASSSPEFEFWMVRNRSLPQPKLLSADELFVDGVILPLQLLRQQTSGRADPPSEAEPEPETETEREAGARPSLAPSATAAEQVAPRAPSSTAASTASTSAHVSSSAAPGASTSKRWKDLFKVAGGEKRAEEKERRRERKNSAGGVAELNINIWPFSRSRSAGNSGARPKSGAASAASGRRVSSAPCSRSNSRGESSKPAVAAPAAGAMLAGSSTRRWASSPGRAGPGVGGGIHVGRASPVWQARRGSKKGHDRSRDVGAPFTGASISGGGGGGRKGGWGGGGVRVDLNVKTCIGYGQQLSCRVDDKDGLEGSGRAVPATVNNGTGSHFMNLRAFFSKKVY